MTDALLWNSASQSGSWRTLDTPLRLLKAWIDVGLIDDADWIEDAAGQRRDAAIPVGRLADRVRSWPPERGDLLSLRLGGSGPRPWTLTAMLFPRGTSSVNLRVAHAGLPSSTELARAFIEVWAGATGDVSIIHADPQWTRLTAGPYKPPIVAGTFPGAGWCTHLGPGYLAKLAIDKLKAIRAYRAAWSDAFGVSLVAAPTLDAALTPTGEAALLRLTAELRAARL